MLVLASMSPRRREILNMAGYEFVVKPADVDESVPEGTPPDKAVVMTSAKKAAAVSGCFGKDDIILAADTVVALDGEIIGKPSSPENAFTILKRLSGRTHTVYTGYCIIKGDIHIGGAEATEVTFRELDDEEILAYVESGEPMDKAGAYGLQGKACSFAAKLNGDFFNVIGLPICTITGLLKKL